MFINKAFGCSQNTDKRSIPDCERTIFCSSPNLPLVSLQDYKYFELVRFFNSVGHKIAICLGFNPKFGEKRKFDRTNQKVANYLIRNGYSGYILVNFYTLLSKNADDIKNITRCQQADSRGIASFFIQNTNYDIFLMYGATKYSYVNGTELSTTLQNAYKNGRNIYISTDSNGNFIHIGNKTCGSTFMPNFHPYNGALSIF